MRRLAILVLLTIMTVACSHSSLAPSTLDASIEATPTTAATHDSITFVVTARGGLLLGVQIDYADGAGDQYPMGGARSARVTFKHAFGATGTYSVVATVTDGVAGQKDASVQVHIN